jgi:hypothetical protein
MASTTENGVATVWEQVKAWPAPERMALASRILQSLEREGQPSMDPSSAPIRRKTLADLWGCMATDEPPPTDEEVEQIIDEAIMRKYG